MKELEEKVKDRGFDALIDGLLGMQAQLPLRSIPAIIKWVNHSEKIAVRASLAYNRVEKDLRILACRFPYCTGIVKAPVLDSLHAEFVGRLRYLNLDFFTHDRMQEKKLRVLHPNALRN